MPKLKTIDTLFERKYFDNLESNAYLTSSAEI